MPSHRGHIELGVWSLLAVVVVLTGTLLYLPRAPPAAGRPCTGNSFKDGLCFDLTWVDSCPFG